ncbi:hypothetical protein ACFWPV_09290 [Streptomyces uncialis]
MVFLSCCQAEAGCYQCVKAGELRFNCFHLGHLQSRHIHEQAELP